MYKVINNKIVNILNEGKSSEETFDVAFCDQPEKAIELLNKARYLNDVKRQYTASARLMCKAEQLTGFDWIAPK